MEGKGEITMKKFLTAMLSIMMASVCAISMTACTTPAPEGKTLYVYTNAGFAPYEYLNTDGEVVGVDIDIMNAIGEELGYEVVVNDIDFEQILNEVAGNKFAVGAAGMTKKPERDEVCVASISYATSVQYVIVPKGTFTAEDLVDGKLSVSKLATLEKNGIGVQSGTTGSFLIGDAIDLEEGELYGSGKQMFEYKDAIVASQDIGSTVGAVIIDKLPAQQISGANENLECFELDAEPESYVLYLNKEATELLAQINGVLQTLIDNGTIAQYTINHSSGNN